ncbi:hypothetical protein KIPB_004788 [Kipferlia bialata]|uniref:MMS19 nucleotide excision repair protein n=1 Tax=Kipferlia bialata TaxID=797122 RepID=A0A9K3CUK0_9EUKA|nr:hypothetical protein KIPB_004788 [Kipferlia bialata]|eukprot:g4788.t1
MASVQDRLGELFTKYRDFLTLTEEQPPLVEAAVKLIVDGEADFVSDFLTVYGSEMTGAVDRQAVLVGSMLRDTVLCLTHTHPELLTNAVVMAVYRTLSPHLSRPRIAAVHCVTLCSLPLPPSLYLPLLMALKSARVQFMPTPTRQAVLSVFLSASESLPLDKPSIAAQFASILGELFAGEKTPSSLVRLLAISAQLADTLSEAKCEDEDTWDDLFGFAIQYFPLDYTPKVGDPHAPSRDTLLSYLDTVLMAAPVVDQTLEAALSLLGSGSDEKEGDKREALRLIRLVLNTMGPEALEDQSRILWWTIVNELVSSRSVQTLSMTEGLLREYVCVLPAKHHVLKAAVDYVTRDIQFDSGTKETRNSCFVVATCLAHSQDGVVAADKGLAPLVASLCKEGPVETPKSNRSETTVTGGKEPGDIYELLTAVTQPLGALSMSMRARKVKGQPNPPLAWVPALLSLIDRQTPDTPAQVETLSMLTRLTLALAVLRGEADPLGGGEATPPEYAATDDWRLRRLAAHLSARACDTPMGTEAEVDVCTLVPHSALVSLLPSLADWESLSLALQCLTLDRAVLGDGEGQTHPSPLDLQPVARAALQQEDPLGAVRLMVSGLGETAVCTACVPCVSCLKDLLVVVNSCPHGVHTVDVVEAVPASVQTRYASLTGGAKCDTSSHGCGCCDGGVHPAAQWLCVHLFQADAEAEAEPSVPLAYILGSLVSLGTAPYIDLAAQHLSSLSPPRQQEVAAVLVASFYAEPESQRGAIPLMSRLLTDVTLLEEVATATGSSIGGLAKPLPLSLDVEMICTLVRSAELLDTQLCREVRRPAAQHALASVLMAATDASVAQAYKSVPKDMLLACLEPVQCTAITRLCRVHPSPVASNEAEVIDMILAEGTSVEGAQALQAIGKWLSPAPAPEGTDPSEAQVQWSTLSQRVVHALLPWLDAPDRAVREAARNARTQWFLSIL